MREASSSSTTSLALTCRVEESTASSTDHAAGILQIDVQRPGRSIDCSQDFANVAIVAPETGQ
jgi:hypothetical protein